MCRLEAALTKGAVMEKAKVHYIKVKVTFDKPVSKGKALSEIKAVLPTDGYYTAPDHVDGATEFKLGSISSADGA